MIATKSYGIDAKKEARDITNSVDLNKSFSQDSVNKVPGYKGSNSAQSNYYNNPNVMASDSKSQSQNSEASALVNDVFYKSPQYDINSNEEWLKNSQYAQQNPEKLI